jgi:hypothetical protein
MRLVRSDVIKSFRRLVIPFEDLRPEMCNADDAMPAQIRFGAPAKQLSLAKQSRYQAAGAGAKVTMAKRSPSMQAVSITASDTMLRSQRYVAAEQQNTLDTVFCRCLLGDNTISMAFPRCEIASRKAETFGIALLMRHIDGCRRYRLRVRARTGCASRRRCCRRR